MIFRNKELFIIIAIILLVLPKSTVVLAEEKEPLYVLDVRSNVEGLDIILANLLIGNDVMSSIDDTLSINVSETGKASGSLDTYTYNISFSLSGSVNMLNSFSGSYSITANIKRSDTHITTFNSSGSASGNYNSDTKRLTVKMDLGTVDVQGDEGEAMLGMILDTREKEVKLKDSGVRFSDLGGEVSVRHDHDRLCWEFAELDMVLYVMDHIKTGRDSSAVLSLPDMTTFVMKENSEIILNTESEKENKLALLYGKVIANVKKMIEDGSMEVDMSQAVAGIKGTIFICDSGENFSRVQVIEGRVEVTDLEGNTVPLDAGQQVLVQDGALGKTGKFLIEQELENWPKKVSDKIYADIAVRAGDTADGETTDEEDAAVETAVQETTVQETSDEETGYKELFEEKIAEHERHEKSRSLLKYALWTVLVVVAAAGVFLFLRKKR